MISIFQLPYSSHSFATSFLAPFILSDFLYYLDLFLIVLQEFISPRSVCSSTAQGYRFSASYKLCLSKKIQVFANIPNRSSHVGFANQHLLFPLVSSVIVTFGQVSATIDIFCLNIHT